MTTLSGGSNAWKPARAIERLMADYAFGCDQKVAHRFLGVFSALPTVGTTWVREVEEVASMLATEPEIAKTIVTHRFPIDDAKEAFRVAAEREAGAIKVVIEP